ncbi:MAG: ABC transporter permease, partial [Chloroflexi bacterium]
MEQATAIAPPRQVLSRRQRAWRTFIRNRTAVAGLVMVIFILLVAIFADSSVVPWIQDRNPQPLLAPYNPIKQDSRSRLTPPNAEHPMGLDTYGRDNLSRIIYGTRVSLLVGVASVALGGAIGTLLGLIAGYTGGKVETFIMRSVDVVMAFPSLIMGLMVLAVLGAGLTKMVIAIGIMLSPGFVRVVHSAAISIKENDYILSARAIGVKHTRILLVHVLPNLLGEVVVLGSIWTASAIRIEASLSFIGLGVSPPTPAWGTMIREGTQYLTTAPYLSIFPGLAILFTVLAFNLLGDGLRDVLDPKLYD